MHMSESESFGQNMHTPAGLVLEFETWRLKDMGKYMKLYKRLKPLNYVYKTETTKLYKYIKLLNHIRN